MQADIPDLTINGCAPPYVGEGRCKQTVIDGGVMDELTFPKGATKFYDMGATRSGGSQARTRAQRHSLPSTPRS